MTNLTRSTTHSNGNKNVLITGGAGFIGSHLTKLFVKKYPNYNVVNLDKLTYAANLKNLSEIEDFPNYTFVEGDIVDSKLTNLIFAIYDFDIVIHCAAESHVDNSIKNPLLFLQTNVIGTGNLLESAKKTWKDKPGKLFYHISTDEVYGALGETGYFSENTAYDPRSPYSASKASSDHIVRAYYHTYNLPVIISNCSNNYGPGQDFEKLIPLCIRQASRENPIPVYGDGKNVRDWLFVEDHVEAIDMLVHNGIIGETYNIGGNNEHQNIDIVNEICKLVDTQLCRELGTSEKLVTFVSDRKGHDYRYAIDASKIRKEIGWEPKMKFQDGLKLTVETYLAEIFSTS